MIELYELLNDYNQILIFLLVLLFCLELWFCRFPLPVGVWEGLRFVIVALPRLFSYLFLHKEIKLRFRASKLRFSPP